MATHARGMRVRRRRPAAARSASPSGDAYRRTRAAIALGVFLVAFGWLWLLNGDFTATFTMGAFRVPASYGWAWHITISACELAAPLVAPYLVGLPRWFGLVLLGLSLPFGAYDVLSSAAGLVPLLAFVGLHGVDANGVATLLALGVAFLPERMIWWLLVALGNVLRG